MLPACDIYCLCTPTVSGAASAHCFEYTHKCIVWLCAELWCLDISAFHLIVYVWICEYIWSLNVMRHIALDFIAYPRTHATKRQNPWLILSSDNVNCVLYLYSLLSLCWHIINNQFCLFKRALTYWCPSDLFTALLRPPLFLARQGKAMSALCWGLVFCFSPGRKEWMQLPLYFVSRSKNQLHFPTAWEWGLARVSYSTVMEKHAHHVSIENCILIVFFHLRIVKLCWILKTKHRTGTEVRPPSAWSAILVLAVQFLNVYLCCKHMSETRECVPFWFIKFMVYKFN